MTEERGTCEECGRPIVSQDDGPWMHVDPATRRPTDVVATAPGPKGTQIAHFARPATRR